MSMTLKTWAALSVIPTAVALYTGYQLISGNWRMNAMSAGAGDDEPVIVVGGSFHIYSKAGFQRGGQNYEAEHVSTGWNLRSVEVYSDEDGAGGLQYSKFPMSGVAQDATVAFTYCPPSENPARCEEITIGATYDASSKRHTRLRVSNPNGQKPIGVEVGRGRKALHHQPDWHIGEIRVNGGSPLHCLNDHCVVVLSLCDVCQ